MARARIALAVLIAVACLTACGDSDKDVARGTTRTVAPSPEGESIASSPTPDGEELVIQTRIVGFTGEVLDGSVLGGVAFCPGGTVRHDHGSPDIGFPAINVFTCPSGTLRIGFGPGPDQMDQLVQTSDWRVLDGTDAFGGLTGEGTMRVEFDEGPTTTGHETFTGVVVVP